MVFVETKSRTGSRERAIDRVQQLVDRASARFAAEDDQEQQWLAARCSARAAALTANLSKNALHLIDAIPDEGAAGRTVNVVGLARTAGLPKGTVSKIIRRLVADELVSRESLPGNRKEVHLRLTAMGSEIRQAHRAMHEEIDRGLREFLDRYSADELAVISKVLTDLVEVPRDGVRFRPELLDHENDHPDEKRS
jgi:DNA-binding MarR family transcriptional regulator